jgi:hypothetical protein
MKKRMLYVMLHYLQRATVQVSKEIKYYKFSMDTYVWKHIRRKGFGDGTRIRCSNPKGLYLSFILGIGNEVD